MARLDRLLPSALAAVVALVAGCADAVVDPRESTARPRIQVAELAVFGGGFADGHIASVSMDDVEGWSDPRPFDGLVEAQVDPGTYSVVVRVFPCSTTCPTWERLERSMRLQRRRNAGHSKLEDQLVECRNEVDVERGDVAVFEPVLEVLDGGAAATCRLEGRVVSTRIE